MRESLYPLLQLQRFFIPALLVLTVWAVWRTLKGDLATGLGLYLGLVIVVDGYLNTGIFLPGMEKGSIRYSEVCAVFLFVKGVALNEDSLSYRSVRFFVFAYFGLLLLSTFRTEPLAAGLFEYRRLIVPQIIAFVIAPRALKSAIDYRRFTICLAYISVFLGLFVFWDLFFDRILLNSDMIGKPEYYTNRSHGRFGSVFLNPNYFGAFIVLVFPVIFVSALKEKATPVRLLSVSALISLAFCLAETQSRAPLMAFGIVIFLLLVGPAGTISRARRFGVFVPFVFVLMIFMPGFLEHASGRFDQIDEEMSTDGARTRETIWMFTERAIADHPLMGIGFGEQQFVRVIRDDYRFEELYGEGALENPHNSYLQMTVYAGVPALIAFLVANAVLLGRALSSLLASSHDDGVAFGFFVGVGGFLTVIYPDMHMFTQTVAPVFWVFVGALISFTASGGPGPGLEALPALPVLQS